MKLNKTTFFSYVRNAPFGGRLTTAQVQGMEAILDYWAASGLTDLRWLAYMFATVFWETGQTMQPIREAKANSTAQAIARLDKAFKEGKLKGVKTPYWRKGWLGRGLVQITHEENYYRLGQILGIDLVGNPDLALQLDIAIKIMFEGMTKGLSSKGDFTGKSLEDYFNGNTNDPVGARKIINGTDKNKLIAGFFESFHSALKKAAETAETGVLPVEVSKEDAKPDDVPAAQSKSLWAVGLGFLTTSGLSLTDAVSSSSSLIGAISNPWALLAFIAVIGGGGVLAWLIFTGRLQIIKAKAVQ